ncbi:MAG: cupredoxin domain-containing protein [Gammaproteobacteria bacterium]
MRFVNGLAIRGLGGALLGAAVASIVPGSATLAGQGGVTHRVLIEKFAFVPETLSIEQGDTVEWINLDVAPHTATQDSGAWDTRNLAKGESAKVVFSSPGTATYICVYHPHMRGRIVVSAARR